MGNKETVKKFKIPEVLSDKIDTKINTAVGSTKQDKLAQAYIKGKEPIVALQLRLPKSLHTELDDISHMTKDSLNQIIVRAIREHVKKLREQL